MSDAGLEASRGSVVPSTLHGTVTGSSPDTPQPMPLSLSMRSAASRQVVPPSCGVKVMGTAEPSPATPRASSPGGSATPRPAAGSTLLRERDMQNKAADKLARRTQVTMRKLQQIGEKERERQALLLARSQQIEKARACTAMSKRERVQAAALRTSLKLKEAKVRAHEHQRAQVEWAAERKRLVDERLEAVAVVEQERVDNRSAHVQHMFREQVETNHLVSQLEQQQRRSDHEAHRERQRRVERLQAIGDKATTLQEEKVRVQRVTETRRHEQLEGSLRQADRSDDIGILEQGKATKDRAREQTREWAKSAVPRHALQSSAQPASPRPASAAEGKPRISEGDYRKYSKTRYSDAESLAHQMVAVLDQKTPYGFTSHQAMHRKKTWK